MRGGMKSVIRTGRLLFKLVIYHYRFGLPVIEIMTCEKTALGPNSKF